MNAHRFHEWPLVVFATLAITGAGLLTAPLLAALAGLPVVTAPELVPIGTALLAAGVLVSLAHLGQPQRAPLALSRAGRSRLSNEIVLASITIAAGAFAAVVSHRSAGATLLASAAAVVFLASLGFVYALPGQLAWRGCVAASPLTLGLGFGTVAMTAPSWNPASAGFVASVTGIALVGAALLAADVLMFACRRPAGAFRHAAGAERRGPGALRRITGALRHDHAGGAGLLAVRMVLVDVLPAGLLLAGLPKGATGFLGLGILVDRLAFYLLAVQQTTESEIADIEAVIAAGGEDRTAG